jgi:hypothetical protein
LLLTAPRLLLTALGLLLTALGLLLTALGLLLTALGLLLTALRLLLTALPVAASALTVREHREEHRNQGKPDQSFHTSIPLGTLQGYPRLAAIVPERCIGERC